MHNDLELLEQLLFQPNEIVLQKKMHTEGKLYGACQLQIGQKKIEFRIAKNTPKKIGAFATLWKRKDNHSAIEPYSTNDPIKLFLITTRDKSNFGVFIFTKEILSNKGVLSQDGRSGKRALRVYPPWCIPTSAQAKKTQLWQLNYFLQIQPGAINQKNVHRLLLEQLNIIQ